MRIGLLLLSGIGCLSACTDHQPALDSLPPLTPQAPADAVLLVDGHEYITRSEVERWLDCVALLEPTASRPQLLRLSLTNFVLPAAVARNIDRRAYEETERQARAIHAKLLEGGVPGEDLPASQTISANWKQAGLDVWWESREREVGTWSAPHETVGGFVIWRVLAAPENPLRPTSILRIERIFLPFLPTEGPQALVEQALFASKLEVLDPAYEELIPLQFRNEMEAEVVQPEPRSMREE